MMKNLTRTEVADWLSEHDHFCILTHRKPDGDTTGSSAALCRGLRSLGKTAWILENPELTPKFACLHEGLTKPEIEENDTVVSVDVAAPGMLPRSFGDLTGKVALRIDHHGSSTPFADVELVDPTAASCADIIYDLFMELWVEMDKDMATALYTGISTDTGCFRFANTNDHSFVVAAACTAAGAPIHQMNQDLFETNSLGRLRLQGWIVEHARFLMDGKVVICPIPKSVEEELNLTEDDLDNISSFPRTIAGVCMAATVRETEDGGSKASVRAVPGWDAAAVCAKFGGGGHKGAAGTNMNLPLEEAAEALARTIQEQVNA